MAGKWQQTFEKGSREREAMSDFMKFTQFYWKCDNSDAYWKSVVNAQGRFVMKYKNDREIFSFVMALIKAFNEEIKNIYKQRKEKQLEETTKMLQSEHSPRAE